MDWSKRWSWLGDLGEGGQGKVSRVLDLKQFNVPRILYLLKNGMPSKPSAGDLLQESSEWRRAIVDVIRMEDPACQGALKFLHLPERARDAARAEERLAKEITAMAEVSHPNLLHLLDRDPNNRWFVSEYHSRGSLKDDNSCRGDLLGALKAFRPVVDAVAKLHAAGFVHRDIKPHNVFIASDGRLVLGDFGLIYYEDEGRTRLSGTFENVGSRDYMAPWAYGIRLEEVRPSSDVFMLGKLLWSMLCPGEVLQLWYYNRPRFDLKVKFPNAPYIGLAELLFERCIVEEERNCLPDAAELLCMVDELLTMIARGADLLADLATVRPCRVCGRGEYVPQHGNTQFYIDHEREWDLFSCNFCGNVQLFIRNQLKTSITKEGLLPRRVPFTISSSSRTVSRLL